MQFILTRNKIKNNNNDLYKRAHIYLFAREVICSTFSQESLRKCEFRY